MATFDPNAHRGDGDYGPALEVPGDFLVAFTRYIGRDRNRNKKPFLKMRCEVIYGPAKGKQFVERLYVNQEALGRLSGYCDAMDWNEPFDLDNASDVRRALCNRPFKATIKVEDGGNGKRYAEIDKPWFASRLTQEERDIMDNWVVEREQELEAEAAAGGGGDPGFGDDDILF